MTDFMITTAHDKTDLIERYGLLSSSILKQLKKTLDSSALTDLFDVVG